MWIVEHYELITLVLGLAFLIAAAIVRWTPTKKDDEILDLLLSLRGDSMKSIEHEALSEAKRLLAEEEAEKKFIEGGDPSDEHDSGVKAC